MSVYEKNFLAYESGLLRKQITENSKKIDASLKELKEFEIRLTNSLMHMKNEKIKAIA